MQGLNPTRWSAGATPHGDRSLGVMQVSFWGRASKGTPKDYLSRDPEGSPGKTELRGTQRLGLKSWPGREKKFSQHGTGPTRSPRRETSKHEAGAGITAGRPGKSMQCNENTCGREAWRRRQGVFSRNCSQRVGGERRGEMEAIHRVGSPSRRGRSAKVIHTAHAFYTPMPSTAPMVVHTKAIVGICAGILFFLVTDFYSSIRSLPYGISRAVIRVRAAASPEHEYRRSLNPSEYKLTSPGGQRQRLPSIKAIR
jgi:hypothetical protein